MQRLRPIKFAAVPNDGSTNNLGSYPANIRMLEFTTTISNFPLILNIDTGLVTDSLLNTFTIYVDPASDTIDLGASPADFLLIKNLQIFLNGKKLTKKDLDGLNEDKELEWYSSNELRFKRVIDNGEVLEIWS